jgi:hypothetical protein
MFEQIADDLLNENSEISITLQSRPRPRAHTMTRVSQQDGIIGEAIPLMKKLSFPGKNADEAWKFCIDRGYASGSYENVPLTRKQLW